MSAIAAPTPFTSPVLPMPSMNSLDEGNIFNREDFIRKISDYMTLSNVTTLRQLSREWNLGLINNPSFKAKYKGLLYDNWYDDMAQLANFSSEQTVSFTTMDLNQFVFQRDSGVFKMLWPQVTRVLTVLNMKNTTFECDGFIFLLKHCPVLETLGLDSVILRDKNDYHQLGYPREQPSGPEPVPVTGILRHLSLRKINKIENCFMDYLIERSNSGLESVELFGCFTNDVEHPLMGLSKEVFQDARAFRQKLVLLLERSSNLKKLSIRNNEFQEHLFSSLAERLAGRTIPEIHLGLMLHGYSNATEFLNKLVQVHTLRLEFSASIRNAEVQTVFKSLEGSLRNLELSFNGTHLFEDLELICLSSCPKLESFKLTDSKEVGKSEMRRLIGGRRGGPLIEPILTGRNDRLRSDYLRHLERRQLHEQKYKTKYLSTGDLIKKVVTHVNPSFLSGIPSELTSLSINHFVCQTNIFETQPCEKFIAAFRKLTKLEFRGPWIHSMEGVLTVVIPAMPNLKSLTIDNCGLTDTMLTGLSEAQAKQVGKCRSYGLTLVTPLPGSFPTQEAELEALMKDLGLPEPEKKYRGFAHLANLEHLDLSNNPISGLSIMYAFRNRHLKNISLDGCTSLTDSSLEFLTLLCTNLEVLSVRNCPHLSKYALNKVVKRCKKLRRMYTSPGASQAVLKKVANGLATLSPDYDIVVDCLSKPRKIVTKPQPINPNPYRRY